MKQIRMNSYKLQSSFRFGCIFFLLLFYYPMVIGQESQIGPNIVKKEVKDKVSDESKNLGKRNTGIMVKETSDGIVFKSHLHTYPVIEIKLFSPNRKLIYSSKSILKQNTDYHISTNGLPAGQYILNFEYEDILVVCNVQI